MKEANSSRELENAIELDKTAITMQHESVDNYLDEQKEFATRIALFEESDVVNKDFMNRLQNELNQLKKAINKDLTKDLSKDLDNQ